VSDGSVQAYERARQGGGADRRARSRTTGRFLTAPEASGARRRARYGTILKPRMTPSWRRGNSQQRLTGRMEAASGSSTRRWMPWRAALRAEAHSCGVAWSAYVTTCNTVRRCVAAGERRAARSVEVSFTDSSRAGLIQFDPLLRSVEPSKYRSRSRWPGASFRFVQPRRGILLEVQATGILLEVQLQNPGRSLLCARQL